MPDLPTVAEGGVAGFGVEGWVGMFVPTGTPQGGIDRLYVETANVLLRLDVKAQVLVGGSEVSGIPVAEMRNLVRNETSMWANVAKSNGIKVE